MTSINPQDLQPDESWPLQSADGDCTGTAHVYWATGRQQVRHPIVFVEGFPGAHTLAYLLAVLQQHGLMLSLRQRGYDVIIQGLDDGKQPIQHNAGVVEACIEALKSRTPQPLVIAGMSMGGLVVRYALAQMERQGRPHQTRAMLSLDTPHRGAYTSLAAQWFVQNFRHAHPDIENLAALLDAPSNQQFVMLCLHQQRAIRSPLRSQFLKAMDDCGAYPQQLERWAIASGRGDGVPSFPAPRLALDWQDRAGNAARLWTLGADGSSRVAEGRRAHQELISLDFDGGIAWEAMPGGQGAYFALAAHCASILGGVPVTSAVPLSCCVPTVSALDLDLHPLEAIPELPPAGCPFHAYRCQSANQPHLYFEPGTCDWLLERLGEPGALVKPAPAFDPHGVAFLRDPYPTYARLRVEHPVLKVGGYEAWWVFRDHDVRAVLQDPDGFLKRDPAAPVAPATPKITDVDDYLPAGLFSADPPWHGRLRAALEPAFDGAIGTAERIAAGIADELLKALPSAGRAELVMAYALPLPAQTLFHLMGVPALHVPPLIGWVTAAVAAHDIKQTETVRGAGFTTSMALGTYFQAMLRAPLVMDAPRNLLQQLIADAADGGLQPEEMQASLVSIAIAGYLSTTFLICTGLRHLLQNPDAVHALLHGNAADTRAVIDELLRLDAPAQIVNRVAARDCSIAGVRIKQGDKLALVLGSANRDRPADEGPDEFRLRRAGPAHLSFGDGIHRCIGEPLARRVTPVALKALLTRLPKLRIEGSAQWQTDPYLRGLSNLPVAWG